MTQEGENPETEPPPTWQPGSPGTFAVVIGVSNYAHLSGRDTYGMESLYVSSLTAFRFYKWLKTDYLYDSDGSCPLAKCWLLLSPTEAEMDFEPELRGAGQEATFGNCKTAIAEWYNDVESLSAASAEKSRCVFFFSGHGLEITDERQILLPSDYLSPPLKNENDAISTENLIRGMGQLKVHEQFFFLDACRNDQDQLKELVIDGSKILKQPVHAKGARSRFTFYASVAGQQAFQPKDPNKGLSLFGDALLDGLRGRPPLELDNTRFPFPVKIPALSDYMNERIVALLNFHQATVEQPIQATGSFTRMPPVTFLQQLSEEGPIVGTKGRTDEPQHVFTNSSKLQGWNYNAPPEATFGLESTQSRWGEAHEIFGSEHMTEIWGSVRGYSLMKREWLPDADAYRIESVERLDLSVYRIRLQIPDADGNHLLTLKDPAEPNRFGVLLPGDWSGRYPEPVFYDLTIERDLREDDFWHTIRRITARLAPVNPYHWSAANLWHAYESGRVTGELPGMSRDLLRLCAIMGESPLSGTLAAILIIRLGADDLLEDYLEMMTELWPDWVDGHILRAEQILNEGEEGMIQKATEHVIKILSLGLPQTSEVMAYAVRQADGLCEALEGEAPPELLEVQRRLRGVLRYFRSGGQFCVFSYPEGQLFPGMV